MSTPYYRGLPTLNCALQPRVCSVQVLQLEPFCSASQVCSPFCKSNGAGHTQVPTCCELPIETSFDFCTLNAQAGK
ncbi:MAG: hypothetical protein JWP34_4732 [Massilia sp.]|nr:hypothetical protein [Massilia sp.]